MTPDEKMKLEELKQSVMEKEDAVGEMEDEMYAGAAPKGTFSPKAMNALVDAINRVVPLFGMEDKLPKVKSTLTEFPPEVMRILSMFQAAGSDAVEADMLPEEALLDFTGVVDDSTVMMLAGKLNMMEKHKPFKKFLARPGKGKEMEKEISVEIEVEPAGEKEMSEEDMDSMFMSRM